MRGSQIYSSIIHGDDGDDIIYNNFSEDDRLTDIYAGDSNDTIYLEGKVDRCNTGRGYDQVYSGGGDDSISLHDIDTVYYSLGNGNDYIVTPSTNRLKSSLIFLDLASTDINVFKLPNSFSQLVFIKETGECVQIHNIPFSSYTFTNATYEQLNPEISFDKSIDGHGTQSSDYLAGYVPIYGYGGNDLISISSGIAYGGDGNDSILGHGKQDILYGDDGNDIINGLNQDDKLYGGAGNDVLNGGLGYDTLTDGTGDDRLYGGFDNDTFIYSLYDGNDVIGDKHGFDVLSLTDINSSEVALTQEGDDLIIHLLDSGENITIFGQFDAPGLYEKAGETTIDRFDFVDESFTAQQIIDIFMAPPMFS